MTAKIRCFESGWGSRWHANMADDILLHAMWRPRSSRRRCQQSPATSCRFSAVFSGICQQWCWKVCCFKMVTIIYNLAADIHVSIGYVVCNHWKCLYHFPVLLLSHQLCH